MNFAPQFISTRCFRLVTVIAGKKGRDISAGNPSSFRRVVLDRNDFNERENELMVRLRHNDHQIISNQAEETNYFIPFSKFGNEGSALPTYTIMEKCQRKHIVISSNLLAKSNSSERERARWEEEEEEKNCCHFTFHSAT